MSRKRALTLILIVLLASSCEASSTVAPATATPAPASGLANPASVFCEKQGFRLEMHTDAAGNQSGVCVFPDGSQCDEWAYYRGECGPAGQATAAPVPVVLPTTAPLAPRSATPGASSTAAPLPATVVATTPTAGAITYTSSALGISFNYLSAQDGRGIKVLEKGDKIYVYPANMEPTAGQWVQVFQKPAGESLLTAIGRVIMPGHPAQDCQVVTVKGPGDAGKRDPNLEYAGIVVRRDPGEDDAAVLPRWRTCPQPYTVVGGIGYFQADTRHPTKFLFLSIGQYAIRAAGDQAWQETIRFE